MCEHERFRGQGCCCAEEENFEEFFPGPQGHGCECGTGHFHFRRRFPTRAERITRLEAYLKDLKDEVQAVEDLLSELKKEP
jgi:hypothetical protein